MCRKKVNVVVKKKTLKYILASTQYLYTTKIFFPNYMEK